MKQNATFEGDNPVVVIGRRRGDAVLAVLACPGLAVFIWAAIDALHDASSRDALLLALMAGMIALFTWILAGALWRLRDDGPVLQADNSGFRVHLTLSPNPVAWADVRSVAIDPGDLRRPDVVRFRLKRRLRSFNHPIGTSELKLALPYLGLSRREAADLLRQLRRLRGATVVADRRSTHPDPDAAD